MKRREIRIGDDLWEAAKAKTHAEGTTVSELVRNFLIDYVGDNQPVATELGRVVRRLNEIQKRLETEK